MKFSSLQIDAALLRPGRLDHLVHCPMPDVSARSAILRALTRGVKLADDVDLDALASRTHGLTGADFKALVANAQLAAAHRHLNSGGCGVEGELCLSMSMLEEARTVLRPSVSLEVIIARKRL